MRARMGLISLALLAALAGCSDDPDSPSGDDSKSTSGSETGSPDALLTEVTVDCPKFEDIALEIAEAQASLYDPSGDTEQAVEDLRASLDELKADAPDDVQQALTDLGSGFEDAAELLENPTQQNRAKLVTLAPKLADAGQMVTTYITEQCG